jgi:hypothetical protein
VAEAAALLAPPLLLHLLPRLLNRLKVREIKLAFADFRPVARRLIHARPGIAIG